MPKRSKISWNDNQSNKLNRAVKNFNAKLKRVAKNSPWLTEYMPEKMSVKSLKQKIQTTADLNREVNKLQRFSRKGAEEIKTTETGLTFSKWHIKEVKLMVKNVNIKRTTERKKLDIDITKGNMGQTEQQNLRPKVFSENKTSMEWSKLVESLEKEVRSTYKEEQYEQYKKNYIKAVTEQLGEHGEKIVDLIKDMSAQEIFENSVNNPILTIEFKYDENQTEEDRGYYAYEEWRNIR